MYKRQGGDGGRGGGGGFIGGDVELEDFERGLVPGAESGEIGGFGGMTGGGEDVVAGFE